MWISKKRFEALEKQVSDLSGVIEGKDIAYKVKFKDIGEKLTEIYDAISHHVEGNHFYIAHDEIYPIVSRFKGLLEHLNLEYREKTETTAGYIKKKRPIRASSPLK